MQKKRVVEFGYTYLPIFGGEEHWINNFSKCLERNGYDVVVVQRGFRDEFANGKPKKVSENITAVPVSFLAPRNVNGPVIDRQPLFNILGFWKLWKYTRKGDIIAVVYPQLYFPSVWLVSKLKGAKVVLVSVGITWDSLNMSFREKILYAMVKWLEKIALKGCDLATGIDTRYLTEARKFDRKAADKKIRIIYNFVHTDFYSPSKKKKQQIILCPRNLRHARGVDLAIKGMQAVNSVYKDAKLVVLGDGPIRGELESLIKKLGVNAEIRHAVGKEELREWYRKASIVVVPSRYSEGSSFAGIEAMSCGTPIVVSNIGGLPDIVKDGYNGFMVNPDAGEIGKAMLKILKDKALAKRMGENGRKMALQKFSYEKFCEDWKKIMHEVEK
jgi:glycosyltransferase involved in cell wall biosynthesis